MAAMTRAFLTILLLLPATFSVQAACFEEAGRRHGIPPSLLKAISAVESNANPAARHRNRDGSEDLGHMQINSSWLRKLGSYGIGREQRADRAMAGGEPGMSPDILPVLRAQANDRD